MACGFLIGCRVIGRTPGTRAVAAAEAAAVAAVEACAAAIDGMVWYGMPAGSMCSSAFWKLCARRMLATAARPLRRRGQCDTESVRCSSVKAAGRRGRRTRWMRCDRCTMLLEAGWLGGCLMKIAQREGHAVPKRQRLWSIYCCCCCCCAAALLPLLLASLLLPLLASHAAAATGQGQLQGSDKPRMGTRLACRMRLRSALRPARGPIARLLPTRCAMCLCWR